MGEEVERKTRVVVESLGWLTESSIMPKKHRAIEGVGAASIMELKAHLYKSQEESKKTKELAGVPDSVTFHRAKQNIAAPGSFSAKNSGVDARALNSVSVPMSVEKGRHNCRVIKCPTCYWTLIWFATKWNPDLVSKLRDKIELKAANDGSASYAALERKAELYNKLVRGELSDEEDKEKYCVDFFRKNTEQDESQQPHDQDTAAMVLPESEDGKNDASFLFNTKSVGLGRTAGTLDNDEHKRFVREVHEEVNQAREKASELKLHRQAQAAAHREKLRQAYLRKRLENLKAASNADQT